MPNWITIADVPAPQPPPATPTFADFMVQYDIYDDIKGAQDYFLSGKMGDAYANPQAYLASKIAYAKGMLDHNYATPLAPADWNYTQAATVACMAAFQTLSELPVNAGDPNTLSIFMAWVLGTGNLYGGHPPVTANTGDGTNKGTATGAPGTIFAE